MSYINNRKMGLSDVAIYGFIGICMLLVLFPFYYVICISFIHEDVYVPMRLVLWPERFSLGAYEYILTSSNFLTALKNTVFITLVGTVLKLYVNFSFAYGLTKRNAPGHRLLSSLVVVTLIFHAGIVPNYLLIKELGLINKQWSLIFPALYSAWDLIVIRSFMYALPAEIEESARIDGCNDLTVFFKIILPLSMASIATFTLFFAVAFWNVYFNAMMYLSDSNKWTLQVLLKTMIIDSDSMGGFSAAASGDEKMLPQETIKMAAIVLAMLPILCVYPFLQKFFAKGVLLGSVKG